jgi:flagellar biosynthesis/type III secretory pathway protein FliH
MSEGRFVSLTKEKEMLIDLAELLDAVRANAFQSGLMEGKALGGKDGHNEAHEAMRELHKRWKAQN